MTLTELEALKKAIEATKKVRRGIKGQDQESAEIPVQTPSKPAAKPSPKEGSPPKAAA